MVAHFVTSLVEVLSINQRGEGESQSLKHYFSVNSPQSKAIYHLILGSIDDALVWQYNEHGQRWWSGPYSASVDSRAQFDLSYSLLPSHMPDQNKYQFLRLFLNIPKYLTFWILNTFTSLSSAYFIPTPKLVLLLREKTSANIVNIVRLYMLAYQLLSPGSRVPKIYPCFKPWLNLQKNSQNLPFKKSPWKFIVKF